MRNFLKYDLQTGDKVCLECYSPEVLEDLDKHQVSGIISNITKNGITIECDNGIRETITFDFIKGKMDKNPEQNTVASVAVLTGFMGNQFRRLFAAEMEKYQNSKSRNGFCAQNQNLKLGEKEQVRIIYNLYTNRGKVYDTITIGFISSMKFSEKEKKQIGKAMGKLRNWIKKTYGEEYWTYIRYVEGL